MNLNEILTREKLEAWLESKGQEVITEEKMWSVSCPVSLYLKENGGNFTHVTHMGVMLDDEVVAHQKWLREFVVSVDECIGYMEARTPVSIQADVALELLRKIR